MLYHYSRYLLLIAQQKEVGGIAFDTSGTFTTKQRFDAFGTWERVERELHKYAMEAEAILAAGRRMKKKEP